MRITRLAAPSCAGGENPMWDPLSQSLYYIDNSGAKVHSLNTTTGASRTLDMPGVIATLVLREGVSSVMIDDPGARGLPEHRFGG